MIQFGTGGWRAIIGENFTKDNIVKVAQSLANLMKKEGVILFSLVAFKNGKYEILN